MRSSPEGRRPGTARQQTNPLNTTNASPAPSGRLPLPNNTLCEARWRRVKERAILESRAQRDLVTIDTRADLAPLHMLLELQTSGQIQLAIYVWVNQLLCGLTTHPKASVCL